MMTRPMLELVIDASADECFRAFSDLPSAKRWVPGLKKVRIVRNDERGRPLEVSYEYGEQLSYALVYAWDDAARKVRWVPSAGVMDGVSGFASFSDADGGKCLFRYSVDSRKGREPNHPDAVAQAFAAWVVKR